LRRAKEETEGKESMKRGGRGGGEKEKQEEHTEKFKRVD